MQNILEKIFPEDSGRFNENRLKTIQIINSKVSNDDRFLQSLKRKNIRVISSKFQDNFSKWLGLGVIETFGGPDNLTIKQINNIINKAKAENIDFIIGNLAGDHMVTAEILSKNLNKPIIAFSNFPELKSNKSMFLNLWNYNISQLESGIAASVQ